MAEFDKFAGDYKQILDRSTAIAGESSQYFTDYKAIFVQRHLANIASAKVLDFGCGVGTLSSAIAARQPGVELHGFDVSSDSLEQIEAGLKRRGVFTSDWNALASDYSLIVISNVLHHIPVAERQETIAMLSRKLAANGRILVFEHNPMNPVTRLVVSRCPFDDNAILLPPRETEGYLKHAGLTNLRRDYIIFFPKPLAFLRSFEPSLAWCPGGAQYALSGLRPS